MLYNMSCCNADMKEQGLWCGITKYFSPFWLHCSEEWMLMFKGVEINYEIKAKTFEM